MLDMCTSCTAQPSSGTPQQRARVHGGLDIVENAKHKTSTMEFLSEVCALSITNELFPQGAEFINTMSYIVEMFQRVCKCDCDITNVCLIAWSRQQRGGYHSRYVDPAISFNTRCIQCQEQTAIVYTTQIQHGVKMGRGPCNKTHECLDLSTRKGPHRKTFEILMCQPCLDSGIIVPYADILRENGVGDGYTVTGGDVSVDNTVACPPPCPTVHQARIGSHGAG